MKKRKDLSRIYTRSGDDGFTSIGHGVRLPKSDLRIRAIGAVDELNSSIGFLLTVLPPKDSAASFLSLLQHQLFDIGAELASADQTILNEDEVRALERRIDMLELPLVPLSAFILPGGGSCAAACHMTRTVCRRAERDVVALGTAVPVRPVLLCYLNRLGDCLFVMARYFSRQAGYADTIWEKNPNKRERL